MQLPNYLKPRRIWLKNDPMMTEKWVQDRIAEDPSLLGLGDIVMRDKERSQPRAGRLDLLMQDSESMRRFEVEIQLGETDESHIIRTVEYWDIERKRYPQYEHCAVIIAEQITARFLNVISLFNGTIPLIAIQMQAMQVGEHVSLVFTTVLDEVVRGYVDEDEEVQVTTDRSYWETRATKSTVGLADELLRIIHKLDPGLELKYNKFYIGLAKNGEPNNFAIFRAKKNYLRLELRLPQSDDIREKLENAGMDVMDYDKRWGRYRIRLTKEEIAKHEELVTMLLKRAHDNNL